MVTSNRFIVNLNERDLSTEAPELAMNLIAAICLNQNIGLDSAQNIQLQPAENNSGWFFECRHCRAANCTGFLRSDKIDVSPLLVI